jgi:hypothetical protein
MSAPAGGGEGWGGGGQNWAAGVIYIDSYHHIT